eukprot:1072008-Pelagomonas_calceolata.AAC.1
MHLPRILCSHLSTCPENLTRSPVRTQTRDYRQRFEAEITEHAKDVKTLQVWWLRGGIVGAFCLSEAETMVHAKDIKMLQGMVIKGRDSESVVLK